MELSTLNIQFMISLRFINSCIDVRLLLRFFQIRNSAEYLVTCTVRCPLGHYIKLARLSNEMITDLLDVWEF